MADEPTPATTTDGDGGAPEPADDKLTAALAAAQAAFPVIEKKHTAEVRPKDGKPGYNYAYADLADVLNAVRPVLAANGLTLTQHTAPGDGSKTRLTTIVRHVGGGELSTDIDIQVGTNNPQAFGGTLTYLRRYEVVTLLGIAAEQDLDAQDVEPPGRGNGARAELPGWAKAATRERVGEVAGYWAPLLGVERTRDLVVTIKDSIGYVPDGMVATLKLVGARLAEALEEASHLELVKQERVVLEGQARKAAEAEQVARAQDASAEAPQVPASGLAADHSEGPTAGHAELDRQAQEAAEADVDQGEPPTPAKPPPGSVKPPDVPDDADDASRAMILRGAGCTCEQPLAADAYERVHAKASAARDAGDPGELKRLASVAERLKAQIDVDCPIAGHAIPF